MNMKIRLTVMNFLQFAVWGAYLTSMGTYLAGVGLGSHIGIFYAMQGIVSLFMPAILGIIADRWVPAQRLLGMSHLLAALFMGGAGYYAMEAGSEVAFGPLFLLYSLSVAFYMPTLGLSNSVAFTALEQAGLWAGGKLRYHRVHLLHVAGRFAGLPGQLHAVLHLCGVGTAAGALCQHAAGLSGEQGRCPEIVGGGAGPERFPALQAAEDGYLLHLLDAAGGFTSDYQRIRQPVHHEFPGHSGIRRYVRGTACQPADFALAGE